MLKLSNLKIDPEFSAQILPLSFEELQQLEQNIIAEGRLLNPIITWNGYILDGHTRYRILKKHGFIKFEVEEIQLANKYEALAWICKNQLGRRNLSPERKKFLLGKEYESTKLAVGGQPGNCNKVNRCDQNDHIDSEKRTCERIAVEHGVGSATVRRAEKYMNGVEAADEAAPGAREEILNGKMLDWNFENDDGRAPQMHYAHRYVEQWQTMRAENLGLLLWGGVGTGKSFLAGCIANALMEQEVSVRMTNFARIMNELNNSFSGRNDIVDKLCRYPLLIIDDFGMERGTEYALEQVYNIVDSRYRSQKPLIVTTNLTLDEIRHPQDTAHARIYDRILEMCVPISCIGASLRKENAQKKLESMKSLIG